MNHFYAGAVAALSIIGIIHFGNFLNERSPKVHEPLIKDMRAHIVAAGLKNYKGTNWHAQSNLVWWIMTTNAP